MTGRIRCKNLMMDCLVGVEGTLKGKRAQRRRQQDSFFLSSTNDWLAFLSFPFLCFVLSCLVGQPGGREERQTRTTTPKLEDPKEPFSNGRVWEGCVSRWLFFCFQ
jgi:hypothetical protein